MKSILIFCLGLFAGTSLLFAQVPNPGFELVDSTGVLLNWRYKGLLVITIGDSIVYDGFLNGKSTNARTGQYALELRNSYNFTTGGQFMNGAVSATFPDSTTYIGFTDRVPLTTKPLSLEFYYKYSQNPYNDSTVCEVSVFNTDDYEIGTGRGVVYGAPGNYQAKNVVINYLTVIAPGNGNLVPSYATIDFKNKLSGGVAHIGQRTLIDDVSFKYSTVSIAETPTETAGLFYPNPATTELTVMAEEFESASITDLQGRLLYCSSNRVLQLDALQSGIYNLQIVTKGKTTTTKLLVMHH